MLDTFVVNKHLKNIETKKLTIEPIGRKVRYYCLRFIHFAFNIVHNFE